MEESMTTWRLRRWLEIHQREVQDQFILKKLKKISVKECRQKQKKQKKNVTNIEEIMKNVNTTQLGDKKSKTLSTKEKINLYFAKQKK